MKKSLEISSFYTHVQKTIINDVWFLRYSAQQMDRRTDGKTDIQRWVPHQVESHSMEKCTQINLKYTQTP